MTNFEIIKGIRYCMIDNNCNECSYHQYGSLCKLMLYNDIMKFLPPIPNENKLNYYIYMNDKHHM